jgi:chromosome segregation ATPase
MSPKKTMASIDNERIFELLQGLDKKVDSYQQTMAEALSRVAGLEASSRAQNEASNRFWATTWPAEQKMLSMMEERIRILEQERATSEKVDKLEQRLISISDKIDVKLEAVASKSEADKLAERLEHLEKSSIVDTTRFKLTNAVLTFIGSTVVSVLIGSLMHHFMK